MTHQWPHPLAWPDLAVPPPEAPGSWWTPGWQLDTGVTRRSVTPSPPGWTGNVGPSSSANVLHLRHISIMASQFTGNSTACWIVCLTLKQNIKAPRYWPFVRGIHWWPVDSHRKGPVMRKAFPWPCHDIIVELKCWVSGFICPKCRQHWFR